jgi:hypothetical protein
VTVDSQLIPDLLTVLCLCPVVSVDSQLIPDLLTVLFVSGSDCGQPAYIRPADCVVCVR